MEEMEFDDLSMFWPDDEVSSSGSSSFLFF
jgi:hypothetical protein